MWSEFTYPNGEKQWKFPSFRKGEMFKYKLKY